MNLSLELSLSITGISNIKYSIRKVEIFDLMTLMSRIDASDVVLTAQHTTYNQCYLIYTYELETQS